jgi:NAD(P)H-hydrate repair Nnr-like enzyme with NAD(P)H-hydrate dehydratase domain
MANTYWLKQEGDKPLFPDLLWSRPETQRHAGKLLIIGGNLHGFNAPAEAYNEAGKAGIGTCRVFLPNALQRTVSKLFPEIEYVPSTPSGSFASSALAELLTAAVWADGALLAGNFGKNSETAILLESFIHKYSGQLTLAGDSIDYFITNSDVLLRRAETTIVLSFAQAQKLLTNAGSLRPLTSALGKAQIVELLHEFTEKLTASIILATDETIYIAAEKHVSTTERPITPLEAAAHTSTWWLQNPGKPFEAMTTAIS